MIYIIGIDQGMNADPEVKIKQDPNPTLEKKLDQIWKNSLFSISVDQGRVVDPGGIDPDPQPC